MSNHCKDPIARDAQCTESLGPTKLQACAAHSGSRGGVGTEQLPPAQLQRQPCVADRALEDILSVVSTAGVVPGMMTYGSVPGAARRCAAFKILDV